MEILKFICVACVVCSLITVFGGIYYFLCLSDDIFSSRSREKLSVKMPEIKDEIDESKDGFLMCFGFGLGGLMFSLVLFFGYGSCSFKFRLCVSGLVLLCLFSFALYCIVFVLEDDLLDFVKAVTAEEKKDKEEKSDGSLMQQPAPCCKMSSERDQISEFAKAIKDNQVTDTLSRITDTATGIDNVVKKFSGIGTEKAADLLGLTCELARMQADMEEITGGGKNLTGEELQNYAAINAELFEIADALDEIYQGARKQAADNLHASLDVKIQSLHEKPKGNDAENDAAQESGNPQPEQEEDPAAGIMQAIEETVAKISRFAKKDPFISTGGADVYLKKARELHTTLDVMRNNMDFLPEEELEKDSQLIMQTLQEIRDMLDGIYTGMRNKKAEKVHADLQKKVSGFSKDMPDGCGNGASEATSGSDVNDSGEIV